MEFGWSGSRRCWPRESIAAGLRSASPGQAGFKNAQLIGGRGESGRSALARWVSRPAHAACRWVPTAPGIRRVDREGAQAVHAGVDFQMKSAACPRCAAASFHRRRPPGWTPGHQALLKRLRLLPRRQSAEDQHRPANALCRSNTSLFQQGHGQHLHSRLQPLGHLTKPVSVGVGLDHRHHRAA